MVKVMYGLHGQFKMMLNELKEYLNKKFGSKYRFKYHTRFNTKDSDIDSISLWVEKIRPDKWFLLKYEEYLGFSMYIEFKKSTIDRYYISKIEIYDYEIDDVNELLEYLKDYLNYDTVVFLEYASKEKNKSETEEERNPFHFLFQPT